MNPPDLIHSQTSESVCYGLVKCKRVRRHVIEVLVAQPHFQAPHTWLLIFVEKYRSDFFNFSLTEDFNIQNIMLLSCNVTALHIHVSTPVY